MKEDMLILASLDLDGYNDTYVDNSASSMGLVSYIGVVIVFILYLVFKSFLNKRALWDLPWFCSSLALEPAKKQQT